MVVVMVFVLFFFTVAMESVGFRGCGGGGGHAGDLCVVGCGCFVGVVFGDCGGSGSAVRCGGGYGVFNIVVFGYFGDGRANSGSGGVVVVVVVMV